MDLSAGPLIHNTAASPQNLYPIPSHPITMVPYSGHPVQDAVIQLFAKLIHSDLLKIRQPYLITLRTNGHPPSH